MKNQPHIIVHGKGPPLVLFHGWGFDAKIWSSLLPRLGGCYQLYLVDLPGFGLTPPMAWDLFKSGLFEQLPPTFAMLGWSMGGLIGTQLAIEAPLRITHLVNIASSPCFIQGRGWPGVSQTVFNKFHDDLSSNPEHLLKQFIELQLQGQTMALGHPPSLSGLQAGLDVLVRSDHRQALKTLTQPVCYMFGRLDSIVPWRTSALMMQLYPNIHQVVFPKAAHAPFLSHPDDFVKALEVFLQ